MIPVSNAAISARLALLKQLCDGVRSSAEIQQLMSAELGYPVPNHYVVNTALRHKLPRRKPVVGRRGKDNPKWAGGRQLNCSGYALVPAPANHPHRRKNGYILEHRLVMEGVLGRYLDPAEVVDHVDGLHLHNAPGNLRLFPSSSSHLKETLAGRAPKWSPLGLRNVQRGDLQLSGGQRIHTLRDCRASGDLRLREILLISLRFGTDSPFALGSSLHTKKAGIDMSSRSTIERALDDLCRQWGLPRTR